MAYCTLADILDQADENELLLYTDDADEGEIDTDVVDAAITSAGGLIDAYLAARYSVPVDPVPDILKTLAVDIALFKLSARRNHETDSVRRRYEDAVNFLKDCAAGMRMLSIFSRIVPPARR